MSRSLQFNEPSRSCPNASPASVELNRLDPATFYQGGERGYVEYPTLEHQYAGQTN